MGERNFQNNLKKLWKAFPLTPIIISMSLMNLSPPGQNRKISSDNHQLHIYKIDVSSSSYVQNSFSFSV